MAMPATIRRWTKELVQSLPNDGNRYELVAGELLVTPAPVRSAALKPSRPPSRAT